MAGGGVAFSQALENQGTGEPVAKYGTGGRITGGVRRFDVGGDTSFGSIANDGYDAGGGGDLSNFLNSNESLDNFNPINSAGSSGNGGAYNLGINPDTGAVKMDFTGMAPPDYGPASGSAPGSLDYGPAATQMPSGGVYDILNGMSSNTSDTSSNNWTPLTVNGQNLTPDQYAGAADALTVNNAGISGLDTLGNSFTSGDFGDIGTLGNSSTTNSSADTAGDAAAATTADTTGDTTGDTTSDTTGNTTDTTTGGTGNTGSDALDAFLTLNNNFVDTDDTNNNTLVSTTDNGLTGDNVLDTTGDTLVGINNNGVTGDTTTGTTGDTDVTDVTDVPPTTTTNRNIYRPQYRNYADPLTMFNVSNYGRDLPTSAGYNYATTPGNMGIGQLNQNLRDIADKQMAQPGGADMNAMLTAMRNSGLTAADLENARYGRTTGLNTPFSQYNKEAPTARTFGGGISELIKKLPS
jgi:hypothetical protein